MADRKKARVFTIYLGRFEGPGEEFDAEDVPQNIKAVDGRRGKIERHIETHLKKHLQSVGKKVMDYLIRNKVKQVDGVFIGTHKELYADTKNNLPKKLQDKVLGEFVMEPNAVIGDITTLVISRFKL